MSRRIVFVSAFAAVLAMAFVVHAQPQGRQRGGSGGGQRGPGAFMRGGGFLGGSLAALAQNEAVQKELGVTDDQKSKLREAAEAGRRPRAGQGGGQRDFQNMSNEDRQRLREEANQRRAEQDKKIADILDAKQLARLKQIQVQAAGAGVLMNEEVAAKLNVTDEQRQKVTEGLRALRPQGQPGGGQGGGPAAFAQMRERSLAVLMDVLTDDQKATLKELAGEPFDLSQLRPQQRPGQQRQRGN